MASRWTVVAYEDVCSAPCSPPYCASLPARLLLQRSLPSQPTLHLSQGAQANQRRQPLLKRIMAGNSVVSTVDGLCLSTM